MLWIGSILGVSCFAPAGNAVVDGLSHDLKMSQAYPDGFGVAVAEAFMANRETVMSAAMDILQRQRQMATAVGHAEIAGALADGDAWGDAELNGVVRVLEHLCSRE